MDRWEYYTEIVFASVENTGWKEYKQKNMNPNWKTPKYAPQTMCPELNGFGENGWELVSMQPVYIGSNADVCPSVGTSVFTNVYLCVFKRKLE